MRFAIPDSDSEDDDIVDINDLYLSGDESEHVPDLTRPPRSKLGAVIRDYLMSSDSENEPDSEDEVGGLLGEFTVITNKTSWREPKSSSKGKERAIPPAPRTRRRASSATKAGSSWRRWEPSLRDLTREEPSEFATLVKETEAAAWREGYRVAGERRARMRQADRSVRAELVKAQQRMRDDEAESLRRMMEGLAVQHKQEEEDTAKRFHEREQRLWADIDAAIKEAERRHGEEQAARAAAERKRKEEEAARIAAEEKAAQARKAEAERVAREKSEQEAKDKAERERQEAEARARDEAERKAEEERKAAADQSNRGAREWTKWVAVQKRMKAEVITAVKLDRNLRQSMRLITRGLGQVVNTKESILRVTNDVCKLFSDQLPRPPSPADPVVFGDEGQLNVPYFYLLSHTAKALIKQADSEVSANPDAAFPLARVIMGIMLRGHAAFGTVLFARLVKKSPWVVPYWPMRAEGQSREEYEKSTGRSSDESTADYIRRMTGIVRMYFAVLALPLGQLVQTLPSAPPSPQQLAVLLPEPWRLPAAWTWAASALRAPLPRFPPTAYLLLAHIDTLGHALLRLYGPKQVGKLLATIREGAENETIKGDNAASRATLLLRIEDWEKSRSLPPPKGIDWS